MWMHQPPAGVSGLRISEAYWKVEFCASFVSVAASSNPALPFHLSGPQFTHLQDGGE